MTTDTELLKWYCAQGWPLIPLFTIVDRGGVRACQCGKLECEAAGKHPRINWRSEASTDVETVLAWAERWPSCNWAVATGSISRLAVIDCDLRDTEDGDVLDGWMYLNNWLDSGGFELPKTRLARSGSGGVHIFYTLPEGEVVKGHTKWHPGVDLKAEGGYIVVPPSLHLKGQYTWLENIAVSLVEDWMLKELHKAKSMPGSGGGRDGDAPSYDYQEAKRSGAKHGTRNDFFNAYAFEMRKQGVDYDEARDRLREVWMRSDNPVNDHYPWDRVQVKLDQIFRDYEPEPLPTWDWRPGAWSGDPGGGDEVGTPAIVDIDEAPSQLDTDTGNAQRLARWQGASLKYTPGFGWRHWTGTTWAGDPEGLRALALTEKVVNRMWREAVSIATDDQPKWLGWCKVSESATRRREMLNLGKSSALVRKTVEDWDADPWLLQVGNGVLDLRTGDLRPAKKEDFIAHGSAVEYDESATSPLLDLFLAQVTGGDEELISYLSRAAGYTLTGSTREEVFFIVSGPQASGKSTFLDALRTAVGTLGDTVTQKMFLKSTRDKTADNALASFQGKRLMTTVEFNDSDRLNVGLLKTITGGDPVQGEFKYQTAFTYKPQFKIWMATNHDPIVNDDATWRRLRQVPFPRTIPAAERRPEVKAALLDPTSEAARAYLAWAVRGCLDWQRGGGLGTSYAVELATEVWRSNDDLLGQFIRDETVECESLEGVTLQVMFDRWRVWAEAEGLVAGSKIKLNRQLRERGWQDQRVRNDSIWLGRALRQRESAYGL